MKNIQFLDRFTENNTNIKLHQHTSFPYVTPHIACSFQSATIAFRFRSILFDKKRALPFFLAIELLTQQKAIAILSRRHILKWKVRKGSLVGCRVTLRRSNLNSFLDTIEFYTPRIESLATSSVFSRIQRRFDDSIHHESIKNQRISEGRLNAAYLIKNSVKSKNISAVEAFSFGELTLFAPFEIGLGLHPDVQNFQLSINFSSRPLEDSVILLYSAKLPVKLFIAFVAQLVSSVRLRSEQSGVRVSPNVFLRK